MKRSLYITMALVALLTSCKTSKTTSVREVHDTLYQNSIRIDTQYINKVMMDTVYMRSNKADTLILHDSIYEREYLKGDTLVLYKYVERTADRSNKKQDTIYRDRLRADTIRIGSVSHDTVYVSSNDTSNKEVVKSASFFQRFKAWILGLGIGALAALAIYLGRKYRISVFHG